jgi:hypothetical protein
MTEQPLVRWALASDEADLIPFPDGKTAIFCAPRPGRYLVFAWTAAGDTPSEAARCVVVVGEPPSPPAPQPPAPPPAPPRPVDPLLAEFRRLFDADPSADKATHARQLAALYRQAGEFADRAQTAGELHLLLSTASSNLLGSPDKLKSIRQRIAVELTRVLPTDPDAAITDRVAVRELFNRIASALESLQ